MLCSINFNVRRRRHHCRQVHIRAPLTTPPLHNTLLHPPLYTHTLPWCSDSKVLCVADNEVLCIADSDALCVANNEVLCVAVDEVLCVADDEVLCACSVVVSSVPRVPKDALHINTNW